MTSSRADRRAGLRLALAVLALGAWFAADAVPALAQSETRTRPRSLLPKNLIPRAVEKDKPATEPLPAPGRRVETPTTRSASATEGSLAPGKIEIDTLGKINPDSVGTLTKLDGGFGIETWAGTPRALVERLLPKMPTQVTSPEMRDLMRRLLLSTAKAPEGAGDPGGLLAMRVTTLAEMGDVKAVNDLLGATPTNAANIDLVRLKVDNLFLANDNARACPLVTGQNRDATNTFWHKAFVFCQALAGEHDKAALGASVLRELGEGDKVYFALIDSLSSGSKYNIPSLAAPSPLLLAMVRAARAQLPADVISTDNPAILKTVATSPNARPELRMDAAERAEAMGALPTDELRQLYTSITFADSDTVNPLEAAEHDRGPLGRALLYRKALVETVPAAMAEVLASAMKLARDGGRYQSNARVYHDILMKLEPTPDLMWFAPEAVRSLLAVSDHEAAEKWLSMLQSSAATDEEAAGILASLMPLARLTGSQAATEWSDEIVDGWRRQETKKATKEKGDEAGAAGDTTARAALLYTLLEATGDRVPEARWTELLDDSPQSTAVMPRPALWRSLDVASNAGRIGETVMLAMLTLGRAGPTQSNPLTLRHVIVDLKAVGLDAEARALAVEAAVAAGL